MNRKGAEWALTKVISITLAVIILLVLLITFFGQETGLLNKIANVATGFADGVLVKLGMDKGPVTVSGKEREDIEKTYNSLIDVMKKEAISPNAECLLRYDKKFKDLKSFEIELSKVDNGVSVQVLNEREQIVHSEEIQGLELCIVAGTKETPLVAKNFFYTFIKPVKSRQKGDFILKPDNIRIIGNGWLNAESRIVMGKYKFDAGDQGLLFKAADNHICLFATRDGGFLCRANKYTLDDNCLVEMNKGKYPDLPFCGE